VVSGDKVAMEPTLDRALQAVFGAAQPPARKMPAPAQTAELARARKKLEEAEKAMQRGSWEGFGKAMEALKEILGQGPRGSR
jgi:uncharacterized membrane protein (UPF0182 family)